MRPQEVRLLKGCGCLASLLLVTAILFPVFVDPRPRPYLGNSCLSNLKQLGIGLLIYSSDENDRFPPRDSWADAIVPYTKAPDLFFDPVLFKDGRKGPYAYAYNGVLSGAKAKEPTVTPLVYDSVSPIRNASDLVTSLPRPGRHAGKDNLAYADGHANARLP